jgi:hypothetical protein
MKLTSTLALTFCTLFSYAQNIFIEAENFSSQSKDQVRKWYVTNLGDKIELLDHDANHSESASGGAYIEILPDTRITHDDKIIPSENFSNNAGEMAIVHYTINIPKAGKYYVWVRAFSTGSEDNGIHVGLDGSWPESGARMQWCEGKNKWTWASKQRTHEVHCGEPFLIYLDIPTPGRHEITFSMREDGFEFDTFMLTQDREFVP